MRTKNNKKLKLALWVEIIFSILAILSVGSLLLIYFADLTPGQLKAVDRFDFVVAVIFLLDFLVRLAYSTDKKHYFKHNWYYLIASIPLVDQWTEALRALRILGLVRLIRAGGHINRSLKTVNYISHHKG